VGVEREEEEEEEEEEERSEAIDKAGTHRLIKIYSSPPPPILSIRLGRAEGGRGRRGRRRGECD